MLIHGACLLLHKFFPECSFVRIREIRGELSGLTGIGETIMARVFIPPTFRSLTNQLDVVDVEGETVRDLIDRLDSQFPGVKAQLVQNDRLRSGWMVAVGTAVASAGLRERVPPDAEVHFLPAIGGG